MIKPASLKKFLQRKESTVRLALVIFFVVGVTGFAVPATSEFFTRLTPVALILSFLTLLVFHHSTGGIRNTGLFVFILLAGYFIEVAGTRTGVIFGEYAYGKGLGPQLLDVPVLIGFNWLMLVYSTRIVAAGIFSSPSARIIAASFLMVLYDLVLEQVAPAIGMWIFSGENPPLRNYISWFALSILFHSLLTLSGTRYYNRIAPFVFFIQLLFFLSIFIILKFMT